MKLDLFSFIRFSLLVVGVQLLAVATAAANLSIVGKHPTSDLTAFRALHTLQAFEDRIYLGYGDWDEFPPVVVVSYEPNAHSFHIEFSSPSDVLAIFREINGKL